MTAIYGPNRSKRVLCGYTNSKNPEETRFLYPYPLVESLHMTSHLELMGELIELGITIELVDGNLLVKPTKLVTEEIVDRVRTCKPELISILAGQADSCHHCGGSVVRDRTFDQYWNRICLQCGCWHVALQPDGQRVDTETEILETAKKPELCIQPLFRKESYE